MTPFVLIIFVLTCSIDGFAQQTDNRSDLYDSWLTKSPSEQLYQEGLDDQKGMGRIFVPAMTSPANEPQYAIFDGMRLVSEQSMGSSTFLPPGEYTVLLGTGTIDQRMVRIVEVHRGQTVIVEPNWCALTIEVIDELRDYVKQDMQVYQVKTFEYYGIVSAINPELGEQLQTLLLEPGLYKIIERGRDVQTIEKFATVLLEEGTYTPYTIVVNSQTGNFTGSGILTSVSQLRQRRDLRLYGAAHGSLVINTANDISSRKLKTNLSVLTQIDNRIIFDRLPHNYLSNNLIELGMLRQQGESIQITQDRLQLKNTYVYYLLKWLGGYSRFEVTTHLFPTYERFESPRDITLRKSDGDERHLNGVDQVRLQPSLFPLGLKEGFGVNITPIRSFQARASLRFGFGFRQIYNKEVYQLTDLSTHLYTEVPDYFQSGVETSVVSNLALLRNLAVTSELDIFFPLGNERVPIIDLENITSFSVTRNITLEHIFRLNRAPSLNWTLQEQFVQVRISYFIF